MSERQSQIAVMMLLQAVRDAQDGDPKVAAPARRWLRAAGADLADMLGISPDRVANWIGQLYSLPYEQLTLLDG